MEYKGLERRNGHTEMVTDIAVIKNELKHIKTMLENMPTNVSRDDFNGHVIQDRVLFTIVTGLLVVILGGMFFK